MVVVVVVVDAVVGFCCFILLNKTIRRRWSTCKTERMPNALLISLVLAVKVQLCVTVKVNPLKCDACELPSSWESMRFYFHFHARIIYAINSDFYAKLFLLAVVPTQRRIRLSCQILNAFMTILHMYTSFLWNFIDINTFHVVQKWQLKREQENKLELMQTFSICQVYNGKSNAPKK